MPDPNEALDLSSSYVAEKDLVLDPSLIDKELVDRLPQPTGWRILIMPFRPPAKSDGGILLAPKTIAYKDKERYPSGPWCKETDWVIFARYAGSRFRLNGDKKAAFGSEVRMLNDDEILGTILDPKDIYHG